MDAVSRRSVARLGLFLAFTGAWCVAIHVLTGRAVTPVPMLAAAAVAAAAIAAIGREPLLSPVLNRWDEAAALGVIACAAHVVLRAG